MIDTEVIKSLEMNKENNSNPTLGDYRSELAKEKYDGNKRGKKKKVPI